MRASKFKGWLFEMQVSPKQEKQSVQKVQYYHMCGDWIGQGKALGIGLGKVRGLVQ